MSAVVGIERRRGQRAAVGRTLAARPSSLTALISGGSEPFTKTSPSLPSPSSVTSTTLVRLPRTLRRADCAMRAGGVSGAERGCWVAAARRRRLRGRGRGRVGCGAHQRRRVGLLDTVPGLDRWAVARLVPLGSARVVVLLVPHGALLVELVQRHVRGALHGCPASRPDPSASPLPTPTTAQPLYRSWWR